MCYSIKGYQDIKWVKQNRDTIKMKMVNIVKNSLSAEGAIHVGDTYGWPLLKIIKLLFVTLCKLTKQ